MIAFLLLFTIIGEIEAQTYMHTSIWSRFVVSKQFSSKWTITADYSYRRQNNYLNSKYNFLEKPFLNTQRINIAYRYKEWQFAFAPSRWYSYQLLGKESDFTKAPTVELRLTPTVEYFHSFKKGVLVARTQYEYRHYVDRNNGRFRERIQYRFPIDKRNDFLIGNEFLLGIPPNSSKRFEQNQFSLLWLPKITSHLEAELGYRNIYRKRRDSEEIDDENTIVASLIVRL